jgi:hypothetical protein
MPPGSRIQRTRFDGPASVGGYDQADGDASLEVNDEDESVSAETMHDAIRAIKDEPGPMLILSTKRVRRGSPPFSMFGDRFGGDCCDRLIVDQGCRYRDDSAQAGQPSVESSESRPAFQDT